MKALAFLLALSLPGNHISLPARQPVNVSVAHQTRPHGQWYLAETGHAVFCYGPVMMVKGPKGGIRRVATFCQGDSAMVTLRD